MAQSNKTDSQWIETAPRPDNSPAWLLKTTVKLIVVCAGIYAALVYFKAPMKEWMGLARSTTDELDNHSVKDASSAIDYILGLATRADRINADLKYPQSLIREREFDDAIRVLDSLIASYTGPDSSDYDRKDLAELFYTRGEAAYLRFKEDRQKQSASNVYLRKASSDFNRAIELNPELTQAAEYRSKIAGSYGIEIDQPLKAF